MSRTISVWVASPRHAPHRRVEDEAQLTVRAVGRADRLVEFQRIDDPVAQEGIDIEPATVGPEHFLFRRLDNQDAIVEINDILDEGVFEMKPGLRDQTAARHRLAKARTSACCVCCTVNTAPIETIRKTTMAAIKATAAASSFAGSVADLSRQGAERQIGHDALTLPRSDRR